MGDAHSSVKRNLLGWHGSFVGKKREKAWRAAPLCLMWTIWKERNRRTFDDMERNNQDIKFIFLYTFVNWVRVYIEEHTLSLIDFVDWLATKEFKGFLSYSCLEFVGPNKNWFFCMGSFLGKDLDIRPLEKMGILVIEVLVSQDSSMIGS
ncbi:hypothetical protein CK203_085788 [Vitis vinifera]|uniref:Uncharacterized protein n=1 Tax=Vitis vinifera TaxID=29760 RepID=A0A438E346_VITVI|nr:hypothetical protein CK203_085788 [Vitis vinifera]